MTHPGHDHEAPRPQAPAPSPQQPGSYGRPAQPPLPAYAPDHPRATLSLVLGILGVVACGVVAPFAWVVGRRTVREIDASQGRVGGRTTAQVGYVLGIIGTVLLVLSALFLGAVLLVTAAPLLGALI